MSCTVVVTIKSMIKNPLEATAVVIINERLTAVGYKLIQL